MYVCTNVFVGGAAIIIGARYIMFTYRQMRIKRKTLEHKHTVTFPFNDRLIINYRNTGKHIICSYALLEVYASINVVLLVQLDITTWAHHNG